MFILGLASFFLYFPAEARKTKGHFLKTKLDDSIPLISEFVIPYILFFPYVFGVFIWAYASKSPDFAQLAVSTTAVSVITTLIYLEYPSMMVRPFVSGKIKPKSLTEKIVAEIESFDRPNNIFPSNHVAYSLVTTMFLVTSYPNYIWIFWTIFAFIAASTVFIKQHDLIDLPAGALLALAVWFVTGLFL